jgi:hypothetical protein
MVYKSAKENPFTPSFGEVPLVMAGRDQLIREFDRALQSTSRRPCLPPSSRERAARGRPRFLPSSKDAPSNMAGSRSILFLFPVFWRMLTSSHACVRNTLLTMLTRRTIRLIWPV